MTLVPSLICKGDVLPSLVALSQICFPENPKESFQLSQLQWVFTQHQLYGVYDDTQQKWVAYAALLQTDEERECISIAVHPDYRRQGIAHGLMEFVLTQTSPKSLRLMVRASNRAALGLYQKMGFLLQGVQPCAYTHPVEDGVHLKLTP